MKLYINDLEVEYKLENEKKLQEVYSHIENEVRKYNKYIIDYKYTLDQNQNFTSLQEIPIDLVKEFFVYTGDLKELFYFSYRSIYEYINEIGTYCFQNEKINSKTLQELKEGIIQIDEFIKITKNYFKENSELYSIILPEGIEKNFSKSYENLLFIIQNLNENNYNEHREEILSELRVLRVFTEKNMYSILSDLIDEVESINIIDEFYEKIDIFKERLTNINISIQTGKETIALELLLDLLKDLDIYITLVASIVEKNKEKLNELYKEIKECFSNIINNLKYLERGFHNNDFIEIGDILEYELSNDFDALKKYIPQLKKILIGLSYQKN